MIKITTYETVQKLLEQDNAHEFYRFQGHNSFEYYNIRTNRFEDEGSHYVYFSRTINHHYYFTIRRIRQLINTTILRDTPYNISRKHLKNQNSFLNIKNLIINSEKIRKLNSIALVCDNIYYDLIMDNSINNMKKTYPSIVERVDRRVYGGGYGITGAWLDLFNDLVYFTCCTRINIQDVVNLLEQMRRGTSQLSPMLIQNIMDTKIRTYSISETLYDDFHKYKIMEDLNRIEEEKLWIPGSEFSKNPKETKKKILSGYQQKRNQILLNYHK